MNPKKIKLIRDLFYDWNDPANPERNELVFDSRLREYGAYVIRKQYRSRLALSLAIAVCFVVLSFAGPMLIRKMFKTETEKKEVVTEEIILVDPPPIDKSQPPPPPAILMPPPRVRETIKFTPPKVVKDEVAEEPPPTQEETKVADISTVTKKGDKEANQAPENPVLADPDEGKVFTWVAEMPSFPGGNEKLMEYLKRNLKYPYTARENGIQGRVCVSFEVDKAGKIKNTKVIRGIGGGCDEEALRVVNSMPEWKAGRQNGHNVAVANIVVYAEFRLQ